MGYMFSDARAFNRDIGQWDVGSVTNMDNMFNHATAFDQVLCWNLAATSPRRTCSLSRLVHWHRTHRALLISASSLPTGPS